MQKNYDLPMVLQNGLWLNKRLTEEAMNHLWDIIADPEKNTTSKRTLAGNISKSSYIEDKDNWFYENVLKKCAEYLFYKEWNNYYEDVITKSRPFQIFHLTELWVNYQKQNEFNPLHVHDGLFSFVVFMKIPTHWEEQYKFPSVVNSNYRHASDFQFVWSNKNTDMIDITTFSLSPEDEGRMLFFPAWLMHQVYPFYGTEEERITLSGNVLLLGDPGWQGNVD